MIVASDSVKHDQVKRALTLSKGHLWTIANEALLRLQKISELVRGFFGDPHRAYITPQSRSRRNWSKKLHSH
jgi:hypothetical protein